MAGDSRTDPPHGGLDWASGRLAQPASPYFRLMPERLVTALALLGALVVDAGLAGCAARPGTIPMAGHRNSSTVCVFGLRGVRIALEDEAPHAINVRLTMCSDLPTLRQRTRDFLAKEGVAEGAADSEHGVHEIRLGHERAAASVEDIRGGVRIRVVPNAASNIDSVRDEIEARIERISTDNRCD
jgi:hypothetical protein